MWQRKNATFRKQFYFFSHSVIELQQKKLFFSSRFFSSARFVFDKKNYTKRNYNKILVFDFKFYFCFIFLYLFGCDSLFVHRIITVWLFLATISVILFACCCLIITKHSIVDLISELDVHGRNGATHACTIDWTSANILLQCKEKRCHWATKLCAICWNIFRISVIQFCIRIQIVVSAFQTCNKLYS